MSDNNKTSRFIPVIIAVSIVVGILIGTFYANHFSGNRLSIINTSSNKLNDLLRIIDDKYVDSVSMGDLVEKAMPQILAELDPHSMYISAKDVEASNADLKGHFSGIGVSFIISGLWRSMRLLNACPSSCASVLTSEALPAKLVITRLMFFS